jgi:AraC-like DNA-binding protein
LEALHSKVDATPTDQTIKDKVHALHEHLLTSEGKLPTLDQLAKTFTCSVKRLNQAFVSEYGKSIYDFISTTRIEAAHAAILNSDTPLKILAARLGYSHVNHFNAAFRKKFGYPPGSLRKRGKNGTRA